jgi:hypothetical protein
MMPSTGARTCAMWRGHNDRGSCREARMRRGRGLSPRTVGSGARAVHLTERGGGGGRLIIVWCRALVDAPIVFASNEKACRVS